LSNIGKCWSRSARKLPPFFLIIEVITHLRTTNVTAANPATSNRLHFGVSVRSLAAAAVWAMAGR
jgi:hypothetical protein